MSEVKRNGYAFVMRYLSWADNPKDITAAERADAEANGIAIGLVFETYAHRATAGFAAGENDARTCIELARLRGFTEPRALVYYFAVDFDAQPNELPAIVDYFRGVYSVLPHARGVYGSYSVCRMLLDAGLVTHAWQTMAWSGGQWESRCNLIQRIGYVTVDGVECDVNETNDQLDDFGFYGGETMASADEIAAAIWNHPLDVPRRNADAPNGVEIVKVPAGDILAANHAQIFWGLAWNQDLWGPGLTVQAQAVMGALSHVITPEQLDAAIQQAKNDVVGVDVTVHRPGQTDENSPATPEQ